MLPHQFFKLLSDETRVRCLLLIAREEQVCVGEIAKALDESQPKVSRHLALLRSSGVVLDTREGLWVFYRLAGDLPGWMRRQIEDLVNSQCLTAQYQQDIQRLAQIKQHDNCCA